MKQVELKEESGKVIKAFVPETSEELKREINDVKKQNLKEHLYLGYLIVGTIAFTLGILISLKRLNGTK